MGLWVYLFFPFYRDVYAFAKAVFVICQFLYPVVGMHAKDHACIDQGFVRPAIKYRSERECTVPLLCVDDALLP